MPLASLVVYMVAYSIGWGPLPWTIMGEMFAPAVKPRASSICVFAIWTFSFLLTKFFANVQEAYGAHTGFWFFGLCCAVSIAFIVSLFPETRGKTLAQIQEELSRGPVPSRDSEGTANKGFEVGEGDETMMPCKKTSETLRY